jgi:outer membrane protein assembly factor BamB
VSGCDAKFRAIRIQDGTEAFVVDAEAYIGASPALTEQFAYFGTYENNVLAVNLATRKIAWRYEHPQRKFPFYASAAITGDYVLAAGRDKMLHCLNAKTGKAQWTFMTRARIDSSPAVVGDRVYFGSNDGRVYGLEVATGKKVWEYEIGAAVSASVAVGQGRLVVAAQDGKVYCFGL